MKPFILLALILSSCGLPLLHHQELSRPPNDATLTSHSFKLERAIILTWPSDAAASSYYLYRDLQPNGSFDLLVYNGLDTSYTDQHLSENFYYYRLVKKRGNQLFPASAVAFGVASGTIEDQFEPNDSKSLAKPFDKPFTSGDLTANIAYFKDSYGNTIEDEDWYYIDLDGRLERTYVLAGDSRGGLNDNDIYLQQEYGPPVPMTAVNGTNIKIQNTSLDKQRLYFVIRVNRANFLSGSQGGRIAYYTLRFVSENPITPP